MMALGLAGVANVCGNGVGGGHGRKRRFSQMGSSS